MQKISHIQSTCENSFPPYLSPLFPLDTQINLLKQISSFVLSFDHHRNWRRSSARSLQSISLAHILWLLFLLSLSHKTCCFCCERIASAQEKERKRKKERKKDRERKKERERERPKERAAAIARKREKEGAPRLRATMQLAHHTKRSPALYESSVAAAAFCFFLLLFLQRRSEKERRERRKKERKK